MSDQADQLNIANDEQQLEYTQSKRKLVVESLMEGGTVPKDRGEKMVLLAALADMDKVSLTKLRIKADEKQSDSAGQASAILAKLLTMVVPSKARSFDANSVMPSLGSDVPGIDVLDGETAVGTQNNTYESFLKENPKE